MTALHPRLDDRGQTVLIKKPGIASPLSFWCLRHAVATVLPDGAMPPELYGVPFGLWSPPDDRSFWLALAGSMPIYEPDFICPASLRPAAGAVVVEQDGRCWVVAPTNRYGGNAYTFPKGRADGRSLKETALIEVFEEAGLNVELVSWLCDVNRSVTRTRFYLARRTGGTPAAMAWESQSVELAPLMALREMLTHPADKQVLDLLASHC